MSIRKAIDDLRNGKIVLIYDFDDREKETDMVIASEFITADIIRTMRKDAGGLLCTTLPQKDALDVGLPFISDVQWDVSDKYPLLRAMAPTDIPYDGTKSSFGITINHRGTYTGITDSDRFKTISELVKTMFANNDIETKKINMGKNFRSPGHVHLLNTSKSILTDRKGHTELSTAMMILAGLKPSATICEMMGDDGNAMSKELVKKYAEKHGHTFVDGAEIIKAWKSRGD